MEMETNRRKYHNVPDTRTVNGRIIRFDSKREAARYDELMLLLKAGKIRNLQLQPEYTIVGAFTTAFGEPVKAERYRADFRYQVEKRERKELPDGTTEWFVTLETIVEDVKTDGTRTPLYTSKRKALLNQGVFVKEV